MVKNCEQKGLGRVQILRDPLQGRGVLQKDHKLSQGGGGQGGVSKISN